MFKQVELYKNIRGLDLLRIFLGISIFVKGISFILSMDQFIAQHLEIPFFEFVLAYLIIFIHTIGGCCLAAGLLTRTASVSIIAVVFGAFYFVYYPLGFSENSGLELTLLVIFSLGLIIIEAPGKFSLDYYIKTVDEDIDFDEEDVKGL